MNQLEQISQTENSCLNGDACSARCLQRKADLYAAMDDLAEFAQSHPDACATAQRLAGHCPEEKEFT